MSSASSGEDSVKAGVWRGASVVLHHIQLSGPVREKKQKSNFGKQKMDITFNMTSSCVFGPNDSVSYLLINYERI